MAPVLSFELNLDSGDDDAERTRMDSTTGRLSRERLTLGEMVRIYCAARHPIHCYKPGHKARARMIMRFAGPRMLFRHPLLTLAHKIDGWRKAEHPRELTRAQRAAARRTPIR